MSVCSVAHGGILQDLTLKRNSREQIVYTGLGHQTKATLWHDSDAGEEHILLELKAQVVCSRQFPHV